MTSSTVCWEAMQSKKPSEFQLMPHAQSSKLSEVAGFADRRLLSISTAEVNMIGFENEHIEDVDAVLSPMNRSSDLLDSDTMHSARSTLTRSMHSAVSSMSPFKSPRYVPPSINSSKPSANLFHPFGDSIGGQLSLSTQDTGLSSSDSESRIPSSDDTAKHYSPQPQKYVPSNLPTILLKGVDDEGYGSSASQVGDLPGSRQADADTDAIVDTESDVEVISDAVESLQVSKAGHQNEKSTADIPATIVNGEGEVHEQASPCEILDSEIGFDMDRVLPLNDVTRRTSSSNLLHQSIGTLVEFIDETEVEETEAETDEFDKETLTPETAKRRLNHAIRITDPLRDGHLCIDEIRSLQMLPLDKKTSAIRHFESCLALSTSVSWSFIKRLAGPGEGLDDEEDEEEILEASVEGGEDSEEGSTINSGSSFLGSDEPGEALEVQSFGSGFSLEARSSLCQSSVTGWDLDETEYEEEEIIEEEVCHTVADINKVAVLDSRREWITRQRHNRSMRQLKRQNTMD